MFYEIDFFGVLQNTTLYKTRNKAVENASRLKHILTIKIV